VETQSHDVSAKTLGTSEKKFFDSLTTRRSQVAQLFLALFSALRRGGEGGASSYLAGIFLLLSRFAGLTPMG
tara:strand:- start:3 stop:218 length:216 start_codon:yes stop_codon:yes gene_type:complete